MLISNRKFSHYLCINGAATPLSWPFTNEAQIFCTTSLLWVTGLFLFCIKSLLSNIKLHTYIQSQILTLCTHICYRCVSMYKCVCCTITYYGIIRFDTISLTLIQFSVCCFPLFGFCESSVFITASIHFIECLCVSKDNTRMCVCLCMNERVHQMLMFIFIGICEYVVPICTCYFYHARILHSLI